MELNLARSPFVNTRPVVRVTIALWIVGALLAGVVTFLYWDSLFGLEERGRELAELEAAIAEERTAIEEARVRLDGMDLEAQNAQAAYLNQQIWQRTFPWSELFEDLGGVMPRRVRFFALSPALGAQERFDPEEWRQMTSTPERVRLAMRGGAADDDVMLELLDNLFAASRFEDPSLPRESRDDDGSLSFDLSVSYLPQTPAAVREHVIDLASAPTDRIERAGEATEARPGRSTAADGAADDEATGPRRAGVPTAEEADPVPLRPAASRPGGGR